MGVGLPDGRCSRGQVCVGIADSGDPISDGYNAGTSVCNTGRLALRYCPEAADVAAAVAEGDNGWLGGEAEDMMKDIRKQGRERAEEQPTLCTIKEEGTWYVC